MPETLDEKLLALDKRYRFVRALEILLIVLLFGENIAAFVPVLHDVSLTSLAGKFGWTAFFVWAIVALGAGISDLVITAKAQGLLKSATDQELEAITVDHLCRSMRKLCSKAIKQTTSDPLR